MPHQVVRSRTACEGGESEGVIPKGEKVLRKEGDAIGEKIVEKEGGMGKQGEIGEREDCVVSLEEIGKNVGCGTAGEHFRHVPLALYREADIDFFRRRGKGPNSEERMLCKEKGVESEAVVPLWNEKYDDICAQAICGNNNLNYSNNSNVSLNNTKNHFIPINMIVATCQDGGIGKDNRLPWEFGTYPKDMAFFRTITSHTLVTPKANCVLMGRNTLLSLPSQHLPKRINVVISTTMASNYEDFEKERDSELLREKALKTVIVLPSFETAIDFVRFGPLHHLIEQVFIIGGGGVYKNGIESGLVSHVYMTRVSVKKECDVFFPDLGSDFRVGAVSPTYRGLDGISYDFATFSRVFPASFYRERIRPLYHRGGEEGNKKIADLENIFEISPPLANHNPLLAHPEYQYLNLIEEIIANGLPEQDRTGVGTLSVFGRQMRFDLSSSFPLLTTKRVFWRGVVEELLWFMRGDTNASHLSALNVKIWEANGSRVFLDSRGLFDREENDLGPVYGFQWRHFGAQYKDMHTDYSGKGVDQLKDCIDQLKREPSSRRIIMSAWNPADLDKMALPPCHMFCQFYAVQGKLSCQLYQRSCDMGLGVPFNIASYALLTLLIAQVCGMEPGEFVHTLGNAHVYSNHIEPLKIQLTRVPQCFPQVSLNPAIKNIDDFKSSDIELKGYFPLNRIAMQMAV